MRERIHDGKVEESQPAPPSGRARDGTRGPASYAVDNLILARQEGGATVQASEGLGNQSLQASAVGDVHKAARLGTSGPASALPYADEIQRSFGRHDVRRVEAHVGSAAAAGAERMGAEAFTVGNRVAFRGSPSLKTAAHEAAHVIQQRSGVHPAGGVGKAGDPWERQADRVAELVTQGGLSEAVLDEGVAASGAAGPSVQREDTKPETAEDKQRRQLQEKLDAPLTAAEISYIEASVQKGYLWPTLADRVTTDVDHNAMVIASGIASSRVPDDIVLAVAPQMAAIDPRLAQLRANVRALGPEKLVNWARVGETDRALYVMRKLCVEYQYTPEGAAGLVGNMFTESALIPNMVEGGQRDDASKGIAARPMYAQDASKRYREFTGDEVVEGKPKAFRPNGTSYPAGVGLVQWTFERRKDLFAFSYKGRVLGKDILFNMDAQIAFMMSEIREGRFKDTNLDDALRNAKSATGAADKVMNDYERPQPGTKRARENAAARLLELYKKTYPN